MSEIGQENATHVYLEGDPGPVATMLSVEQVAGAIENATRLDAPWVRLPLTDGREALVRPDIIVAIVPESGEEML